VSVRATTLVVACLALAACGRDAPAPATTAKPAVAPTPAPIERGSTNSGSIASAFSRSVFRNDDKPSAATLAEARQMDEIQQLMEDDLYDQARAKLKAVLAAGGTHPVAFLLQARLLYQQSHFEDAVPWCNKAIAASGYWIEPRVLLAQSYMRLKRLAAAESVFADLDRLAPKAPWGPYGQGITSLMRGDRQGGTAFIDEALRRDPDHLASLRTRIELAAQARDGDLAERLSGRYLAQEPNSGWAYELLGDLATTAGRLEDARRAYLRAYECDPTAGIARHLAELAQRRGDSADARVWQERAGIVALDRGAPAKPPPPH
jgi:tetratricopeptide (TPR) repeat protein